LVLEFGVVRFEVLLVFVFAFGQNVLHESNVSVIQVHIQAAPQTLPG
jgi:hypothetical protein